MTKRISVVAVTALLSISTLYISSCTYSNEAGVQTAGITENNEGRSVDDANTVNSQPPVQDDQLPTSEPVEPAEAASFDVPLAGLGAGDSTSPDIEAPVKSPIEYSPLTKPPADTAIEQTSENASPISENVQKKPEIASLDSAVDSEHSSEPSKIGITPGKSNAPDELGKSEVPDESGKSDAPAELSKSDAPDELSQSDAPDESGKSDAPDESGKSDAPDESGKLDAPDESGKSDAPDESGKSDAPDESGKSDAPDESGKSDAPDESGKSDAPDESGKSGWVLISFLLASLITNILLASTALYLLRWRKLPINDEKTPVPEHGVNNLDSVLDNLVKAVNQLVKDSSENSKKSSDLNEILDTLHRLLDNKDKEIKRYKQGYDAQIYKRFVRKFILITASLNDALQKKELQRADYEAIHFRLEDALEDCGVESRDVEIGSDYRNLGDLVEDNPGLIPAEDADQNFKVAELVRPAYVLTTGEKEQVVIPAKVKIFFTQNKGA